MGFGSQNLLTGLGIAGVALVMTVAIVPHVPRWPVEDEGTGPSQESDLAIPAPRVGEGPGGGSQDVRDPQPPGAPPETIPVRPLTPELLAEPVPERVVRIPDPVPAAVPAPEAVPPAPDIRVASRDDTSMDCLPDGLRRILDATARRFGYVEVVSTRHLRTNNHNAGRAKIHADCMAADIRTPAEPAEVVAYVRTLPGLGGVARYRNGIIHLDDTSAHPPDAYARRPSAE